MDATGARWTLSGGYIYVNGVRNAHSYGVQCLAYEDGRMWQEKALHLWWEKTRPTDMWAPSGGTVNSRLLPITVRILGSSVLVRTDPGASVVFNSGYTDFTRFADAMGSLTVSLSNCFVADKYSVNQFSRGFYVTDGWAEFRFSTDIFTDTDNLRNAAHNNFSFFFGLGGLE